MAHVRDFTGVAGSGRGVRAERVSKRKKNYRYLFLEVLIILGVLAAPLIALLETILLKNSFFQGVFVQALLILLLGVLLSFGTYSILAGTTNTQEYARVRSGFFNPRLIPKNQKAHVNVLVDRRDLMSEPLYSVEYGYIDTSLRGVEIFTKKGR